MTTIMSNTTGDDAPLTHNEKALFSFLIVFLVIAAGGTAGLQVALFSIDRVFLRVQRVTGTSRQRGHANKLLRVLDMQHWTLVALILLNASCMMTLPVVLESVFDELTALIVSITAVLFLGEVIPLSVFVRWAIPICSFLSPVIWFAIVITAPVSFPVGRLLDKLLGTEELLLDREDLAALIVAAPPNEEDGPIPAGSSSTLRERPPGTASDRPSASPGSPQSVELSSPASLAAVAALETARQPGNPHQLREREAKMLQGAMQLSTDTVGQHLRVKEPDALMLSSQDRLDRETIRRVLASGFSRLPVYFGDDRKHIIGALIVNSLLRLCFTNPDPPPLVGDYPLREVMRLAESSSLYDAYVAFRDGAMRMAVVYDTQGIMVGILTLTDVLACMYHANPSLTVAIRAPNHPHQQQRGRRRQERLRELVEGLKFLNAAKNQSAGNSGPTSPLSFSGEGAGVGSPRLRTPSPGVVVSRRLVEDHGVEAAVITDAVAQLPQFTLVGGAACPTPMEDIARPGLASPDGSVAPVRPSHDG